MNGVHVSTHPLVRHQVARLRHRDTPTPTFRELVRAISRLLVVDATADLATESWTVPTPLADCDGERIAERIGLVPVLRAGLGMAEAMLDVLPDAGVWHLGLYRDHTTLQPVTYYNKLPPRPAMDRALMLDPMLATGGSAVAAIDLLKQAGVARVTFIGLIGAPEGVRRLHAAHPDVPIYLAALDRQLNEIGYIVPGLGDAGDRQFGTA